MATARLDMKLDENIKAMAEKAAALLGRKSLTEYVVGLMEKDAKKVIAEYESMTVKDDIFDRFMDACKNANKPGQTLRDAVTFTREQGIK
ncbi:MAG: DUF1778 domain-containing protein [Desulfuromonadales bacterium]|nr:DUF1778 domain-containing protein [Desulfuromonadales bacterium]